MNNNRLVTPIWSYLVLPILLYAIASAGGGSMNSLREYLMLILLISISSLGVRHFFWKRMQNSYRSINRTNKWHGSQEQPFVA